VWPGSRDPLKFLGVRYANSPKMVKATDFKFDVRVSRDSYQDVFKYVLTKPMPLCADKKYVQITYIHDSVFQSSYHMSIESDFLREIDCMTLSVTLIAIAKSRKVSRL